MAVYFQGFRASSKLPAAELLPVPWEILYKSLLQNIHINPILIKQSDTLIPWLSDYELLSLMKIGSLRRVNIETTAP
jgi:hypothetical protein